MFLLPVATTIVGLMLSAELSRAPDRYVERLLVPWLVIAAAPALAVVLAGRGKRCGECGFQWETGRELEALDRDQSP